MSKREAAIRALADCLRHPDLCAGLAECMHDMGNYARLWLEHSKRCGTQEDIESYADMVRENDLAENLLRALAELGREPPGGGS